MTTRTITAYQHTCHQPGCGHVWISMVKDPQRCSKCFSTVWRTTEKRGRGRPRFLPDELSEDLTRYNREAKRKSRRVKKIVTANANYLDRKK